MKKVLSLILLSILAFPSFAVKYKGFADVDATYLVSYSTFDYETLSRPTKDRFSLLITTTHGLQFGNSAFIGIGVGLNQMGGNLSMRNMPLYFDARWTLNCSKKITPFIDLKLGASLLSNKDHEWFNKLMYRDYIDKNTWFLYDYFGETKDGVFIKPTIGCRFALSNKIGVNVGITYYPQWGKILEHYLEKSKGTTIEDSWKERDSYTRHFVGLNVGIDF